MTPEELSVILRTLLTDHPNLKSEAEAAAVELVSTSAVDDVAEKVFEVVTSLGIEDVNDRAGSHSWGYVEPTEAAWELLEEAVGGFLSDMKRRAELGLVSAASVICCGIVLGLYRARTPEADSVLVYAPDYPSEGAFYAVQELIRATPKSKRKTARAHLQVSLPKLAPEWRSAITPSAGRRGRRK